MNILLTGLPVRPLFETFVTRLNSLVEAECCSPDFSQLAGTYSTKKLSIHYLFEIMASARAYHLQFALRVYGQAAYRAGLPLFG